MNRLDEWSGDPSVRVMRGVFALMESRQDTFLEQAGIDRYDPRLRAWRDKARGDFEKSWREAAGGRIQLNQEQLAALYLRCLGDVMRSEGLVIPNNALETDDTSRIILHRESGQ